MLKWFRDHAGEFEGDLRFSEALAPYTYYKLGGPADLLAAPRSDKGLQWLADGIAETGIPVFILGAGSNLLVSDAGFRGLIIRSAKIGAAIERPSPGRIRVGAAITVSALLRQAAREGWGGLEFLTGVPGTVGGVVVMNAGTHLGEAKDRLRRVDAFVLGGESPGPRSFATSAGDFAYRRNLFLPPCSLVTSAEWEFTPEDPAVVKARVDEMLLRRKSSQPVDLPSCGSVFKNPREAGLHAWQVIEKLGMRGFRVGGAEFSPKHCNFIVNLGNAKADDVRELIETAKRRARAELGISLEEEVRLVGF